MVKTSLAVAVVALVGLFGYFYLAGPDDAPRTEKAKQAAKDVGDAVRDKGVAGLVDVRLATKFGLDATRFLHAHYDEGRVVVYGLAPAKLDVQMIASEAAEVPGVTEVELLVHPRPEYIAPLRPITAGETGESSEHAPEP